MLHGGTARLEVPGKGFLILGGISEVGGVVEQPSGHHWLFDRRGGAGDKPADALGEILKKLGHRGDELASGHLLGPGGFLIAADFKLSSGATGLVGLVGDQKQVGGQRLK